LSNVIGTGRNVLCVGKINAEGNKRERYEQECGISNSGILNYRSVR
jgi:hypothetical protein